MSSCGKCEEGVDIRELNLTIEFFHELQGKGGWDVRQRDLSKVMRFQLQRIRWSVLLVSEVNCQTMKDAWNRR